MANVFNTTRQIDIRYDLKGSKKGRTTFKKADEFIDPSIAFKDLDFDRTGETIYLDSYIR